MAGRIVTGFIAAMLSVLLVHQVIILLLAQTGWLPPTTRVYNMAPLANALPPVAEAFKSMGFQGWPILFNSLFWGGLWGILFAVIHTRLPGGFMVVKGLLFGLLVLIVSNWIVLPLLRGQPLFAGFLIDYAWRRLVPGLCILGGFGTGLGFFYSLLRRRGAS
jgi:hypothetical protein